MQFCYPIPSFSEWMPSSELICVFWANRLTGGGGTQHALLDRERVEDSEALTLPIVTYGIPGRRGAALEPFLTSFGRS